MTIFLGSYTDDTHPNGLKTIELDELVEYPSGRRLKTSPARPWHSSQNLALGSYVFASLSSFFLP